MIQKNNIIIKLSPFLYYCYKRAKNYPEPPPPVPLFNMLSAGVGVCYAISEVPELWAVDSVITLVLCMYCLKIVWNRGKGERYYVACLATVAAFCFYYSINDEVLGGKPNSVPAMLLSACISGSYTIAL